jgi:hypothetical protein
LSMRGEDGRSRGFQNSPDVLAEALVLLSRATITRLVLAPCRGHRRLHMTTAISLPVGRAVGLDYRNRREAFQDGYAMVGKLLCVWAFRDANLYAKESGYVQKLYVDYGTRVKAGQVMEVMAVLEIPELETRIEQDEDAIQNAIHQVAQAQKELDREEAQRNVTRLQFTRCGSFACAPECRRAD